MFFRLVCRRTVSNYSALLKRLGPVASAFPSFWLHGCNESDGQQQGKESGHFVSRDGTGVLVARSSVVVVPTL